MHDFEENFELFKMYLKSHGWTLEREDNAFIYFRNSSDNTIRIPLIKNDEGFPAIFEVALNNLQLITPELFSLPLISIIKAQLINMRQKYLKEKKKWVLLEPNSKYLFTEIPDMYVPKKSIFTNE